MTDLAVKSTALPHRVVSRDEWLAARKAHLKNEKALTRQRDLVAAERRALPWVKVEKEYVFGRARPEIRSARRGKSGSAVSIASASAG
jgi:predicted dithiol-disulfide oxidoreductase (DUF899 family)